MTLISTSETYTSGYVLRVKRDVTMADMWETCAMLATVFGDGYEFRPEPITEGGIMCTNWPGKETAPSAYKTMRLRNLNGVHCLTKWPRFDPAQAEETWKNNTGPLYAKDSVVSTFLKAFEGAPKWTVDELEKFALCLHTCCGLEVRRFGRQRGCVSKHLAKLLAA